MDGNGYDLRNSDCFPSFRRTEMLLPGVQDIRRWFPLARSITKGNEDAGVQTLLTARKTFFPRICKLYARNHFLHPRDSTKRLPAAGLFFRGAVASCPQEK